MLTTIKQAVFGVLPLIALMLGYQEVGMSQARASGGVKNVVLVHGGFVDGSGWRGVYELLKKWSGHIGSLAVAGCDPQCCRELIGDHIHSPTEERRLREAALDETLANTFPASDPPSSIPNPMRRETQSALSATCTEPLVNLVPTMGDAAR